MSCRTSCCLKSDAEWACEYFTMAELRTRALAVSDPKDNIATKVEVFRSAVKHIQADALDHVGEELEKRIAANAGVASVVNTLTDVQKWLSEERVKLTK